MKPQYWLTLALGEFESMQCIAIEQRPNVLSGMSMLDKLNENTDIISCPFRLRMHFGCAGWTPVWPRSQNQRHCCATTSSSLRIHVSLPPEYVYSKYVLYFVFWIPETCGHPSHSPHVQWLLRFALNSNPTGTDALHSLVIRDPIALLSEYYIIVSSGDDQCYKVAATVCSTDE